MIKAITKKKCLKSVSLLISMKCLFMQTKNGKNNIKESKCKHSLRIKTMTKIEEFAETISSSVIYLLVHRYSDKKKQ